MTSFSISCSSLPQVPPSFIPSCGRHLCLCHSQKSPSQRQSGGSVCFLYFTCNIVRRKWPSICPPRCLEWPPLLPAPLVHLHWGTLPRDWQRDSSLQLYQLGNTGAIGMLEWNKRKHTESKVGEKGEQQALYLVVGVGGNSKLDTRISFVCHARITPPEIWNRLDWRALVESRPPNIGKLRE